MTAKNEVPTFVKWAGGKTQLLGQFRRLFPRKIDRYIEPFLGSGAVFFYIKKHYNPKKIILSDINDELINCFKVVRDNPKELIGALKEHKVKHNKEYFYEIRKQEPNKIPNIERASRFIYLNKTCFNGLYRVNSKGKFNVPIGSYENPSIVMEKKIMEAHRLLQRVILKTMPFSKIVSVAKPNDFVYFDPPYLPISKTASFTSYTKNSFSKEDQKKLADTFNKLDKKGCLLMLSNSYHPFMKKLYSQHRIEIVKAGRVICCDPSKRGKIKEMVVLNYKD